MFKIYCKKYHCIIYNYKLFDLKKNIVNIVKFDNIFFNKIVNSLFSRYILNYYTQDLFSRILKFYHFVL